MKTSKVLLHFTQEAEATVCPHCNREYVIYAIFRDSNGKQNQIWPQVGGYCYLCGKSTDERTEKINKLKEK